MKKMKRRLVRIGTVAEEVGVSESVINRLVERHKIPYTRLDDRGNRFFDMDKVMAALGLGDDETLEEKEDE